MEILHLHSCHLSFGFCSSFAASSTTSAATAKPQMLIETSITPRTAAAPEPSPAAVRTSVSKPATRLMPSEAAPLHKARAIQGRKFTVSLTEERQFG